MEKGWIADDGVEAALFEDFGEDEGPVDGPAVEATVREVGAEPEVEQVAGGEFVALIAGYDLARGLHGLTGGHVEAGLPLLRVGQGSAGGEVCEQPGAFGLVLDLVEHGSF